MGRQWQKRYIHAFRFGAILSCLFFAAPIRAEIPPAGDLTIRQEKIPAGQYSDFSMVPKEDEDCIEEKGLAQDVPLYTESYFERSATNPATQTGQVANHSFLGRLWGRVKRGIIAAFDFFFALLRIPQKEEATYGGSGDPDRFSDRYRAGIDRQKGKFNEQQTAPAPATGQVTVLNTRSVTVPVGDRSMMRGGGGVAGGGGGRVAGRRGGG